VLQFDYFMLGPVTTGMGDHLRYFSRPLWLAQPPSLSGMGNEYQPKCDDAVWLGSKCNLIPLVDEYVDGR